MAACSSNYRHYVKTTAFRKSTSKLKLWCRISAVGDRALDIPNTTDVTSLPEERAAYLPSGTAWCRLQLVAEAAGTL